jgi:hypothetical protein
MVENGVTAGDTVTVAVAVVPDGKISGTRTTAEG